MLSFSSINAVSHEKSHLFLILPSPLGNVLLLPLPHPTFLSLSLEETLSGASNLSISRNVFGLDDSETTRTFQGPDEVASCTHMSQVAALLQKNLTLLRLHLQVEGRQNNDTVSNLDNVSLDALPNTRIPSMNTSRIWMTGLQSPCLLPA